MKEKAHRILVVDDVQLFKELEKTFLTRTEFEIHTACTGAEALEKARVLRPKLMLLDLQMPGMSGVECCEEIKKDPELKDICVIIVTDRGNEADRSQCMEAGCDGFITKPVTRTDLLSKIRHTIYAGSRSTLRLPISVQLSYAPAGGVGETAVTLNIASVGMYIATRTSLEVGTALHLSFELPGLDKNFFLRGEVVWNTKSVAPGDITPGLGIRFTDIDDASAELITRYVEEQLS